MFFHPIVVVKDFLNTQQIIDIESFTTSVSFPWFFTRTITPDKDYDFENYIIKKGLNPCQFVHSFKVDDGVFPDEIFPVLNGITTALNSNIQIKRLKFNLLNQLPSKSIHWPHCDTDDFDTNHLSCVYYVNDSDGPTYLFNEFAPKKSNKITLLQKIEPEKGKMVIFDSRRFHCSSSPNKIEKRIVLNVVFRID